MEQNSALNITADDYCTQHTPMTEVCQAHAGKFPLLLLVCTCVYYAGADLGSWEGGCTVMYNNFYDYEYDYQSRIFMGIIILLLRVY